MDELSVTTIAALAGLVLGMFFGGLTHRTNFCAMGAVADAMSFGDYKRARAWLLAIAVAIVGAQLLQFAGLINLNKSIYLGANLDWFGAIAGGIIFGFGMVLASGCPGRNLARTGGGDIKAFVVLVFIGLFAYMTLRGIMGLIRVALSDATSIDLAAFNIEDQGLGTLISSAIGIPRPAAQIAVGVLIVAGISWFCFKDEKFRSSPNYIIAGLGLGVLVTAGWWATGVLSADEFEPQQLTSLTFVAPTGDGLQYLMTYTGSTINFGIATVGGAIIGAFLSAITSGRFAWSAFSDKADTVRHLFGAAMMGIGGVTALGCTIGQGITGMSTLALGSVLALAAIATGGVLGMRYLERALGI